jgi:hypothetical protein
MTPTEINCAVDCVNGCQLGENCPHQALQQEAAQFIQETSLEDMIAMAEAAVLKRRQEQAAKPPQWVIPDEI